MKNEGMKKIYASMAVMMLALTACSDDNDKTAAGEHEVLTYKVAMFSKPEQKEWLMQTIGWAQSIMARAQVNQQHEIRLEYEWMDQSADKMDAALSKIEEGDYVAVLGPTEVEEAKKLLDNSMLSGRTIILPSIGSADLQRIYAAWDNVFILTESDVMQNEILLSIGRDIYDSNLLALVTSDDGYGNTFREWFGFQAEEMGSHVTNVDLIGKDLTVAQAVENYRLRHKTAMETGNGQLWDSEWLTFFFPSSSKDLLELDRVLTEQEGIEYEGSFDDYYWADYTACSDRCVDYDIAPQIKHQYFGVEPAPLPESGFAAAYEAKFGKYPKNGTAQTFDTAYLLTYALALMDMDQESDMSKLWEYIVRVIDGDERHTSGWSAADVELTLKKLKAGETPYIKGVSSTWQFDERFHCAPEEMVYRYWTLNNGQYSTIAYVSANGSYGGLSNFNLWDMERATIAEIADTENEIKYNELKDKYAVVVAASTGWENYRHQADALAMYQLLKDYGYDDDHILLIMEDDIANNERNPRKGEVRVEIDGENLYHDLKIDYKLSDLTYDDLIDIMAGKQSEKLPVVLPTTNQDNVLFFWSGHGNSGTLYMNDSKFPADDVSRMLQTMNSEGKYRRLFFVIEACYSGSVAQECEGIPGVLFLTAANASETSKADIVDKELKTYLSNGFTRGFQQKIRNEYSVSLRDLYYHVAGQTVGSHARMYNIPAFGSVYKTNMDEFLKN